MIIPASKEDQLDPPPPYTRGEHMRGWDDEDVDIKTEYFRQYQDFTQFESSGKGLVSSANIAEDGRINITMHFKEALPELPPHYANPISEFAIDPSLAVAGTDGSLVGKVPRMSIVIMIVGSRGDVQPFLALGQELHRHGHRVRIATHGTFRSFVKGANLEFFDIGGDPHELMSYMVKNPGLMPGWTSLTNGDIPRKQKMLSEILEGCWNACSQPDIDDKPFIADAIISNPPAFAHVHCAEALGIPLQLSFTMPWCSTTAFPHPLVNISQSNAEPGLTNYLSYGLAEMMTWKGLGGVINEFRTTKLGLEPLTVRSGPGAIDRLKVPWTYCYSPELVPKPDDWQNHIDVVGFYFLDLATGYTPAEDLAAFLAAGPPPIYIGFGSVVVEDPAEMTRIIFEATERAGVRALVSAGWGGLGNTEIPPNIFILGNVPHDWLFTKVFAVCHHGGAGTTAIGLRLGKPTIVVPFFGDQPFWGAMIHKSGAGPKPIRKQKLDVERLTNSIEFCKTAEAKEAAEKLGEQIRAQNGVKNGVESFYRHLPVLNMRCDIVPEELAVWWSSEYCLKLSAVAAQVLDKAKLLDIHKLEIHRSKEYDIRAVASDPLTGGVVEALRVVTTFSESIGQIFTNPKQGIINTTTALPRSVLYILDSLTEGLSNTPALYGSGVREPGVMKDFKSGMKEGGKAFLFGLSDGITGLWVEPAEGFKRGGARGLIEGSLRSYVNLAVRPAAGSLRLVTYPIRGALMSLHHQDTSTERHLRQLRVDQGKDALSAPSRFEDIVGIDEREEKEAKGKGKGKERKNTKRFSLVRHREESLESHLRGLHIASPGDLTQASSSTHAEIIEKFKIACQKENVLQRKNVMHKRIQWIITRGTGGSLTERPTSAAKVAQQEPIRSSKLVRGHGPDAYSHVGNQPGPSSRRLHRFHDPHMRRGFGSIPTSSRRLQRNRGTYHPQEHHPAPMAYHPQDHFSTIVPSTSPPTDSKPLPPLPTRSSTASSSDMAATMPVQNIEWTEEDEALFLQQMHTAKQLSLQSSLQSPATSAYFPPEEYQPSPSDGALTYEDALLAAAAEWSQQAPNAPTFEPEKMDETIQKGPRN